jgi:glycerol transport system ATP-binding protein
MARIEFKHVAHSYAGTPADGSPPNYALNPVNTSWDDGGAYALLGPSGCGKTTLLNIISGLLKPSEGKVFYDGTDVTGMTPERRNIAQVFQFPVLYDTMTVFDNLAFPLRNRKVPEPDVKKRVLEIADMLELSGSLNLRASGLGADAKQKISLGRGLVRSDVAAILFDEPLTVIDPHMKWLLRRKLKEIHERFKVTLIYVTHDQVEALTFADRVVIMNNGEIIQTGTPEELFEFPSHTFVGYFIGSPGMNFFPCEISGNKIIVDGYGIPVSETTTALAQKARGALQVGIRPIHLSLESNEDSKSIPVSIRSVADHGHSRIVSVEFSNQIAKVRVPEDKAIPLDKAWLRFPPEKTLVYADGKRLHTEPGGQS